MKVLLYFENEKAIRKSGVGRALQHQKKALELNGVEYTTNPKDSYDIAHVNTYFGKSLRLVKKCKKNNIPVIVHGHSTKEDFKHSFKAWWLMQPYVYHYLTKTYSKPDKIITPTPYSKRLIDAYDFVKCPVVSISNGIDIEKYATREVSEERKKELREMFKLSDSKVVMGIGWMFERKGFHDFIEIAKSLPDVKFIWFGQKSKILNTHKINKAIANKTDNVILPGYVPQDVIIDMLHMSDLFMFPSYEETEGIVLLEALACKTPLLIREIGAFDYLTDSVDCFKATTNEGFIDKINYVFNNDVSEVVSKGYEVAHERRLENVGALLKQEYEKLLKK